TSQTITLRAAGTYTVTVTSTGGCSATASRILTVNSKPSIAVTPLTSTICQGKSSSLTASGASTYAWSPSTGLNTTTGATVSASPSVTTTYTVTGTNAVGCTGTATSTVTVNASPTATVLPLNPNICPGNNNA